MTFTPKQIAEAIPALKYEDLQGLRELMLFQMMRLEKTKRESLTGVSED